MGAAVIGSRRVPVAGSRFPARIDGLSSGNPKSKVSMQCVSNVSVPAKRQDSVLTRLAFFGLYRPTTGVMKQEPR
jgi:hypothetical protein